MSRQSVLCHDCGAELCRNKVRHVHDRDAHATKVFCHDILGTVVKKKKKKPLVYGVS